MRLELELADVFFITELLLLVLLTDEALTFVLLYFPLLVLYAAAVFVALALLDVATTRF